MNAQLDIGLLTRKRVRIARQTETAECGLACIAMVAGYHGLDIDLGTLRRRFGASSRGTSLKTLMGVADTIGLTPRAVKAPLDQLGGLALPAILHWNMNHFVVLEKVGRRRAFVHDPDGRSRWLSMAEISDHFTGVALELEPSNSFETGSLRQRLRFSHLWGRIRGLKRTIAQTIVLSLVLQAFVLASPYYLQLAVDSALPALDNNLIAVLALGFGLFALINGVATLLRSFVLLSAGASFGFGLSSNLARRLFRLPVDWFEKRPVGDILSRFQSVVPIRLLMTEDAVSTIVDGVLALLTLAMMLVYSPLLSLVAVLAFALYAMIRLASFRMQRNAQEEAIVASSKEQSVLIESLRGMRTLRLFNKETLRHALWQSRMTDSVNGAVRMQRIAAWQTTANTTIFGLENVVTIGLGMAMVISGGFSIGMVVAYLAYKTQFLRAAASLVDKSVTFRMIGLHLERLADIALAEEDISFAHVGSDRELAGEIELKDVFYRYGPDDPMVLKGVNLHVRPGESIAITGSSGGGKSTLVRVLLGLVEPTGGTVFVDGVPLSVFGHRSFHQQIAAVLQDDVLFAGSIADNISMFDDEPDMARIRSVACAAVIADDIEKMPMGYETLVGDMGSSLSGGQRQRVMLARALYRSPRLLVMDEGTSNLDYVREKEVNDSIAALGITTVVVAHRKETIDLADRVLILRDGRLHPREEAGPAGPSDESRRGPQ
jgi:ATP-binding cassette, subfamily B, bacterial CvaB/MchF/RaxB